MGIEWRATRTSAHKAFGFTSRPGDAGVSSWTDLEFGVRMDGSTLEMIENGLPVGALAGSGDALLQLRVRSDHRVEFVVNGAVQKISARTITKFPLFAGVTFRTENLASQPRARLRSIRWVDRVGRAVEVAAATLEGDLIMTETINEGPVDSSHFYGISPDQTIHDDHLPRVAHVLVLARLGVVDTHLRQSIISFLGSILIVRVFSPFCLDTHRAPRSVR